ncbi:MAG: hypothetical protein V4655_14290 [Bdellovibrionota bacterium]|nr:MAG: hypothetical protein EOP10_12905 [Pseudomonadota bacterium]
MGVKNTTIGQVLGAGALAFIGHQLYKRYAGNKQIKQDFKTQENKLDTMLEDTFPASDPMPLSRSGSMR